MKKIKNLTVTCKYSVSLSDIEVSDDVCEELMNNCELNPDNCCNTDEMNKTIEWLADNINESDAFTWEYEIEDVEE